MSNNNRGYEITKQIVEVIRTNENKNIKWRYEINNKLIIFIFIYYLKLFFYFKSYH